ncbi:MAG: hypothetical protein ACYDEA_08260 [Candidatus Dormibacteria bacterium]
MARRNRVARAAARSSAAPVVESPIADHNPTGPAGVVEVVQGWSPTVARLALGLVLLWFGLHELFQPSLWTGYVPGIAQTSALALGMVLLHGWVLVLLGAALMLGIAPRLAAAVSALLLLEIVLSLSLTGGLSDIVARDLGVFGLAVAVFASDRQRLILRG